MKDPVAYLTKLLGEDGCVVTMAGKTVDLRDVVALRHRDDLEEVLAEHPERAAGWRRILAKCRKAWEQANDAYGELRRERFIHYYRHLEDIERKELADHYDDETAPRDDFRRKLRATTRVAAGVQGRLPRWRRNFTDDLVWGYVESDPDVVSARKRLRMAKNEIELALTVVDGLDHRMRCLSHLCAFHRDSTR